MAVSRKAMTEGIRTPIFLCAFIDAVLQSLSQKSKIFASSLYTREPLGHGKAVTDKGHLPLPMGEVPEAERAIFTLSVGFAASSPRVGAKGEREKRIVTGGIPRGSTKGSPC